MLQLEGNYIKALETSIDAAEEIMRIYNTAFEKKFKSDGSPVTSADVASSAIINDRLKPLGIPIISEEDPKISYEERSCWKRVWIIDPLDGTKEFIRRNGEFVVNIALVEEGTPIFGLIASPVKREVLFGGNNIGAFISKFEDIHDATKWRKLNPKEANRPIVLTSSRTPYKLMEQELIDKISEHVGIDFIKKGSALKFFDLAEGNADVYPRYAPTMEWDIAAGQAILEQLGGVVLNLETGKPLTYNKESLYNPHFIAKMKGYIELFG